MLLHLLQWHLKCKNNQNYWQVIDFITFNCVGRMFNLVMIKNQSIHNDNV